MFYLLNPTQYKLKVELTDFKPSLASEEEVKASELWKQKSALSDLWHNGVNLSCINFQFDGNQINMKLGQVDYKTYTYIRDTKTYRPGGYTVGIEILIYDASTDKYVFTVRSSKVGFDNSKIGLVGGVVPFPEKPEDCTNFFNYLKNHALTELNEEAKYSKVIDQMSISGLFFDEMTYKLDVVFKVTVDHLELLKDESMGVVTVSKNEAADYVHNNREKFAQFSYIHLSNLFPKII